MRNQSLSLLAALAISSVAIAQSPLTTTFTTNNGQDGNMFDVVATNANGVTINYFDVNLDAGSWDMEVYKLTTPGPYLPSVNNAADWTLVGTAMGVTSAGGDQPTLLPIPVCEYIPAGQTQSFYVTCTGGFGINYVNGTTTGTVFASNADLEFLEGAGLQYPFTANFNPRVWSGNIHYIVGDNPGQCISSFAQKSTFGTGCYPTPGSIYEQMTPAGMDLGGMTVTGTVNGSNYDVTVGPSTINPIGGSAQALALGDDAQADTASVGGTLGLHVGSNGWVAFGAGNSNGFSPSVATMLSNANTAIYAWTDLEPNNPASGQVWYEESGSVATVTYDGVFGWGTTDGNTMQFIIDTATGDYSIAFGTVSANNPEDWLIGRSPGGASPDPGPSDLSAAPFTVPVNDNPGLALDSSAPIAGSIWSLQLDNCDPASPFAVFAFGDAVLDPAFDLTPLGGAGCFVYTNANLGFFMQPIFNGSSSINVLLPNLAALQGAFASAQGAAFTPLNSLTFATSNGLSVIVGSN